MKVQRTVEGKGWFVYTLSGLVVGDISIAENTDNKIDIRHILGVCITLGGAGFARISRKGWRTIDHPDLGLVQWKSGIDFRSTHPYFLLRVNGEMLLKAWPNKALNGLSCAEWVSESTKRLSEEERVGVEDFLGTLQTGTLTRVSL